VQGDLDELYTYWYQRAGEPQASLRYVLNVLSVLPPFVRRRPQANQYAQPSPFHLDMVRSYMTIARRHLWHNRLYTFLNVMGLAIGLSACWIIYRLVSYEYAFNQHHVNKERIFRIVTQFDNQFNMGGNAGVPLPLTAAIRTQVPGIERAVSVRGQWMKSVYASRRNGKAEQFREVTNVVATDSNYFDLIHYQWLAGNAKQSLAQPQQVVLAQSRAERYFPGLTAQQVIGRTMTYFDTLIVQVTGVVADPAQPTSFEAKEFLSLASLPPIPDDASLWDNINSSDQTFVRLSPTANPERVEQQVNAIVGKYSKSVQLKSGVRERWHPLQPLTEMHFGTQYGDSSRRVNKDVLNGLMALAGFILLLACINYINLTTAQIPARAREIGIRKTLGSRRGALIIQFLGETLVITIVALSLAFVLSQGLLHYLGDLIPDGTYTYINWPLTIVFLTLLVVVVSVLAGIYPGWLVTRFQPVAVLRGVASYIGGTSSRGLTLRKGLIVVQFVMAQVFIIAAWLIGQQLHYSLDKDMGFDRDAVLTALLPREGTDQAAILRKRVALRQALEQLPGVATASLGNPPANQSFSMNEFSLKRPKQETKIVLQFKYVDTNYVHLYKIPLLAGRNVEPSDTFRDLVLNETAVKQLGFARPENAIGQVLHTGTIAYPIVGVVRDFQVESVRQKIHPVVLVPYQQYSNDINIKLASNRPSDWQGALADVEKIWKSFYPDEPFKYAFYDETLTGFYKDEQAMARIINLATAVAILISCLGLFGLATLTAFQRTKEIGVRKVLGASVGEILALLTRDFIKLVMLAIIIATPIAWYLMNQWLQSYAYKIDIEWWVFALAGLSAIGIALLTVSFQSIKAALTNPVKSLRTE
jgi:predicted permease